MPLWKSIYANFAVPLKLTEKKTSNKPRIMHYYTTSFLYSNKYSRGHEEIKTTGLSKIGMFPTITDIQFSRFFSSPFLRVKTE